MRLVLLAALLFCLGAAAAGAAAAEADFASSSLSELRVTAPEATLDGLNQWAGYVTLPHKPTCRLFAWVFEKDGERDDAPTIVFQQGGPGASVR